MADTSSPLDPSTRAVQIFETVLDGGVPGIAFVLLLAAILAVVAVAVCAAVLYAVIRIAEAGLRAACKITKDPQALTVIISLVRFMTGQKDLGDMAKTTRKQLEKMHKQAGKKPKAKREA